MPLRFGNLVPSLYENIEMIRWFRQFSIKVGRIEPTGTIAESIKLMSFMHLYNPQIMFYSGKCGNINFGVFWDPGTPSSPLPASNDPTPWEYSLCAPATVDTEYLVLYSDWPSWYNVHDKALFLLLRSSPPGYMRTGANKMTFMTKTFNAFLRVESNINSAMFVRVSQLAEHVFPLNGKPPKSQRVQLEL
jgi:hypothetical protein